MASDSFTDTNGTTLPSHDSDWADIAGAAEYAAADLTIQDNEATAAAFTQGAARYSASSETVTEFDAHVDSIEDGQDLFAFVRCDGSNEGYKIQILSTDDTDWNYWVLYRDGSYASEGSITAGYGMTATHTFVFDATDTSAITLTVDGNGEVNYDDTGSAITRTGNPGIGMDNRDTAEAIRIESWTDQASADTTAPTLSSTNPTDDATGVSITVNPTATFSEDIAFGTGNITLRTVSPGSTVETFDVTTDTGGGAGTVSISGDTLTIEPTNDLSNDTQYAIRIASTAIDDLAGNSFAGFTGNSTWNFTTEAAGTFSMLWRRRRI